MATRRGAAVLIAIGGLSLAAMNVLERYACPACGVQSPLFRSSAADAPAADAWASIPFDPRAAEATDRGLPLPADSAVAPAFEQLVARISAALELDQTTST